MNIHINWITAGKNMIFKRKSFESVKEESNRSQLQKTLSGFDLVLLGLGAIIGTGVFTLTGLVAAQYSGPAVTISYLLAGVICIFVALGYTEIATTLPTSGSIYTYSYVLFGEIIAWLVGCTVVMELCCACSVVAGGWSAYFQGILNVAGYNLPEAWGKTVFEGGIINLPACGIVIAVGSMLYFGTKDSKKLNTILVFVKIAVLFLFMVLIAPSFDATINWVDFMPYGFDGVLFGTTVLFFSFKGFAILATTAEECKNPKKDLVVGILGSLTLCTVLYMIVGALLTGVVSYKVLNNAQPLAYVLQVHGYNIGSTLVATGGIAGMTTVIMMNIYGLSRICYVVARDGLLPKYMVKIHPKYGTPYIAIAMFTIIIAIMAAFLPYFVLAKLASMAALIDYSVAVLAAILLRVYLPNIERSFKCPLLFVLGPITLVALLVLLFREVIDKDGSLLLNGRIMICWFLLMLLVYISRKLVLR